jgi:lipopolysaccharide/colanic/teichoic acid biosynthesis glycosyltransferase
MSIVGPRPMLDVTVREYQEAYSVILRVRPGLTGLSQVSGRNNLTRSARLDLDENYALTWSIIRDIEIIISTFGAVWYGEGQRNDQSRSDVEK